MEDQIFSVAPTSPSEWTERESEFLRALLKGVSPKEAGRDAGVDGNRMLARSDVWEWLHSKAHTLPVRDQLALFAYQAAGTLLRAAAADPAIRPIHVRAAQDVLDRAGFATSVARDRRPNSGADFGEVLAQIEGRGARAHKRHAPQTGGAQTGPQREDEDHEGEGYGGNEVDEK